MNLLNLFKMNLVEYDPNIKVWCIIQLFYGGRMSRKLLKNTIYMNNGY